MVGYFGVNAYTGKYGLNARQELDQEIIALTSELARLKRERLEGEQRVSLLRSDRVDPDMLDERARYQLDYANPRDLVKTSSRTDFVIVRCALARLEGCVHPSRLAGRLRMTDSSANFKNREIDFENVRCVAVRHSKIFCAHAILSWRFELG